MKIKTEERILSYIRDTDNRLNVYFKHKSNDITVPRNIELMVRHNGTIGYNLKNKCWVIGQFNGVVDENNEPTTYVCTSLNTENRESYELKNHEEVVVLRNNSTATPDNDVIRWDAMMRAENDISMYYQLVNSRNIPVIVVDDDKIKKEVERIFDNIEAGRPAVVSTRMIDSIEVKDILDHDAISKMECLNELNEVLTKRALNWFGGTMDIKDKKAQVTSTELKAYDDYTTIGFLANYEPRLEFMNEMKENGIDYEIVRNPIFTDEPTEEEIETGEMEEEENEENNIEGTLENIENEEQSVDDDGELRE